MTLIFIVFGLTRQGIEPESTVSVAKYDYFLCFCLLFLVLVNELNNKNAEQQFRNTP